MRKTKSKTMAVGEDLRPAPTRAREAGFTFIELMMVLLIFSVLTAAGLQLYVESQKSLDSNQSLSSLFDSGLRAIRQMTSEIGISGFPTSSSFSATAVATYPGIVANSVITAKEYDFVFEADIDGDGRVERVEYVLPSGSQTIWRNVTKKNPDGTLASSTTASSPFLDHVQNQIVGQQLFTWQLDSSSTKPFPKNIRIVFINAILRTTQGGGRGAASLNVMGTSRRAYP